VQEGESKNASGAINIVAFDEQPIVLLGIEHILSSEPELNLQASFSDRTKCLDGVSRLSPDILILDISMSDHDCLNLLHEMSLEEHPTKAIIFTQALKESELLDAFRLGVQGVVLKTMPPALLCQCIRKVYAGEQWYEKESFGRTLRSMIKREKERNQTQTVLTAREMELTRLVATGLDNSEIANRLHIQTGTVKVHLHRIYTKLGIKNRVELSLYARDAGLI
jgi:DNA-binding NarL/FixJ family response regulator